MKRILFVVPDLEIGGVQRALVTLLCTVPPDELDLTLLTFREGGALLEQVPAQVLVRVERRLGRSERLRAGVSNTLRALGFKNLFRWTKKLYHRLGSRLGKAEGSEYYNVAVAYADGLATWYVAQSVHAGEKIAFVHTDVSRAGYDAQQEGGGYACFARIVFGSQAARQSFLSLMPQFREKTELLPNIVDPTLIVHLAEQPSSFETRTDMLTVVTVGRLSTEKGVGKVPLLLRRLKDAGVPARWYLVGEGPERGTVLQLAHKLDVDQDLILTGALQNPYPYMRGCDIYVQPSEYEGYCIAVAEARALCRPIVACDFAGAREQLEDGVTGFVTGMHVEEIFPAILILAEQPERRVAFREALKKQQRETADIELLARWWDTL